MRKLALEVKELDIDLIDRINPFEAAYAILAKNMNAAVFQQVQAAIATKRVNIPPDEALELAKRAAHFKKERGRIPDINAQDPWERRLAEGASAFMRYKADGRYSA